jgi:hypothetical protein
MNVREAIERHRRAAIAVASAVLLIVIVYLGSHFSEHPGQPDASQDVFYSADDGKTYFADRMDRMVPFDHGGTPAFRAAVFRCDQEPPFVAFLMQPDESARKDLETAQAKSSGDFRQAVLRTQRQMEVKRPGEQSWVEIGSAAGTKVTTIKCPEGTAVPLGP